MRHRERFPVIGNISRYPSYGPNIIPVIVYKPADTIDVRRYNLMYLLLFHVNQRKPPFKSTLGRKTISMIEVMSNMIKKVSIIFILRNLVYLWLLLIKSYNPATEHKTHQE